MLLACWHGDIIERWLLFIYGYVKTPKDDTQVGRPGIGWTCYLLKLRDAPQLDRDPRDVSEWMDWMNWWIWECVCANAFLVLLRASLSSFPIEDVHISTNGEEQEEEEEEEKKKEEEGCIWIVWSKPYQGISSLRREMIARSSGLFLLCKVVCLV